METATLVDKAGRRAVLPCGAACLTQTGYATRRSSTKRQASEGPLTYAPHAHRKHQGRIARKLYGLVMPGAPRRT